MKISALSHFLPTRTSSIVITIFVLGYVSLFFSGAVTTAHLFDNVVSAYLLAWGLYGLVSTLPRTEVAKRFITVTFSLIAVFAVLELIGLARLVDYRAVLPVSSPPHPAGQPGMRYDPDLIWQHEPGYHYVANYEGNLGHALCQPSKTSQKLEVDYDADGFRNARPIIKADTAVIGDSYVESPMTPDVAIATTLLSELTGQTVANLGHAGYGPQQELIVLKRYALRLEPRTIIWMFFEGNDFADAEKYEAWAASRRSNSVVWQNLWFRSFLRNVLNVTLHPSRACQPSESIAKFRAQYQTMRDGIQTVYFAPTEVNKPSDAVLQRAAAPIIEAARLCEARGIRFVVAFTPEKFRVYHDLANVTLGTPEVQGWEIDDVSIRLQHILRASSAKLIYVDLTGPLKAAARAGRGTYLSDDTHWTTVGHEIVAHALQDVLRSPESKSLSVRALHGF